MLLFNIDLILQHTQPDNMLKLNEEIKNSNNITSGGRHNYK